MINIPTIEKYGENLTKKIKNNPLKYGVFGRDAEIENMFEILNQVKKNNPLLLGEAGVGKTAVVEGFAKRIIEGDESIPEKLKNKIIFSIELSSLKNNDEFGDFTSKLSKIISEAKENKSKIILFIDEIHTIVGTGSENSALDAGNILKPVLSRGEIQLIGATTLNEYDDFLRSDEALERRFNNIILEEPSVENTITILSKAKNRFEKEQNVIFPNETIEKIVKLSKRFITDKYLPDKAFDVLDRSSVIRAKKKLKNNENDSVNVIDVAESIAKIRNISLDTILKPDSEILNNLKDNLLKRVKGQDHVVEKIVRTVYTAKAGLNDPTKPLSSFLFLGGTGTGKTEITKGLTKELFSDEDNMIRFDMSEYGNGRKLTDFQFQLANAVKKKPESIVLLDEIEKANVEILNFLLQLLDDARIKDERNRLVDFKNTYIILTSNLAHREIRSAQQYSLGDGKSNIVKEKDNENDIVQTLIQSGFKPEIVQRIDNILVFNYLTKDIAIEIAELNLEKLKKRLYENEYFKNTFKLEFDNEVKDLIIERGFNDEFGARQISREINSEISNILSRKMFFLKDKNPGKKMLIKIGVDGEKANKSQMYSNRKFTFKTEALNEK